MVIDMMSRPPMEPFTLDEKTFSKQGLDSARNMFNAGLENKSAYEKSIIKFIQEMDESGVDKAVAPVRATERAVTDEGKKRCAMLSLNDKNDMLADALKKYSKHLVGMIAVDPNEGVDLCLTSIEKYVVHGPATGVNLEPTRLNKAISFDDPQLSDVYRYCEENGIPITLTFGGRCCERLEELNPLSIDGIARRFPDLHMILLDGGYPWVTQVCWIAQTRPNVYLAPSLYIEAGGGKWYVEAAKMWIPHKICFASMYPAASLHRAVEIYKSSGFDEKVFAAVMGENASKALFL